MRDTPQARNRAGILMPIKENEIGRKSILKYFQRAMLSCVGCHLLSLTVSNNILCSNIMCQYNIYFQNFPQTDLDSGRVLGS